MCRAMCIVVLMLILTGSTSAALVAEWKMDEGSGTSAADTLGGSALTWNATSNISWNGSGGTQSPTNALSFDGLDYPDQIGFPTPPAYKANGAHTDSAASSHLNFGTGSFSVALDFKTDATVQTQNGGALVMKGFTDRRYSVIWRSNGGADGKQDIGLEYDSMSDFDTQGNPVSTETQINGKSQFYVNIEDITTDYGLTINDGQWHQLIATVDRDELDFEDQEVFNIPGNTDASPYGTLRLRIDDFIIGEMALVSDQSFDEPNTAFTVGFIDWVDSFEFDGEIDNVQVYDTAITSIPTPTFDPADFNEDNTVDGLDLTKWNGDYGVNGNSDADGDGDSDGADMLIWQRNLGNSTATATVASVPEPASIALLLLAFAGLAEQRRRR